MSEEQEISKAEEMTNRMDEFFDNSDASAGVVPDSADELVDPDKPQTNEEQHDTMDELVDPDAPSAEREEIQEEEPPVEPEEPVEPAEESVAKAEPEAPKEEYKASKEDAELKLKLDKNDEFDAETFSLIAEMSADPYAGIKFAKLRGELKAEKALSAELESGAVNTPEMQDLKLKADRVAEMEVSLKTAEDKLAMFDFTSTPEYQTNVSAPLNDVRAMAASIEKGAGIPDGSIMTALTSGDRAKQNSNIDQIIDEFSLSRREQSEVFGMAHSLDQLHTLDASMREGAQERMAQASERQISEDAYQAEQQSSLYRKTLNDTFSQYEGKVGVFVDSEGNNTSEWNDAIASSQDLDFKDVELQALGAYALAVAPALQTQNSELAAEVSKLKTLLGRHRSASPQAAVTGASSPNAAPARSQRGRNTAQGLSDSLGRRLVEAGLADS